MFTKAVFNDESEHGINVCQKWQIYQCYQIVIMRICRNRVVCNTEGNMSPTQLIGIQGP